MNELNKQDQDTQNNSQNAGAPKPNSMPFIADLKRPELRNNNNDKISVEHEHGNANKEDVEINLQTTVAEKPAIEEKKFAPPPPPPPRANSAPKSDANLTTKSTVATEDDQVKEEVAKNIDNANEYLDDIASALETISENGQESSVIEPILSEENNMQQQNIIQDMVEIEEMATKQQAKSAEANNIISQVVFDEILRQHNEWLISDGKEGRRANLHSLDLRHIVFGDANLQQSNMRATIVSGVDLSRAILVEADLTEATLEGVRAIGANWSRINLSNVNLTNANLAQTNLSYANLFRTNLFSANLEETNLENANLRDAIMANANFSNAYLKDAVCRGADLTQTIFNSSNLTNVDMRECLCRQTRFIEAILDNTSFKNAHFEDMSFTTADFTNALDIPLEYQNKGFKMEKESIEQGKNELKQMQVEAQQKQKELLEMRLQMEEQRNMIGSLRADEEVYVNSLRNILGHLKLIKIMWGVVLMLFLLVTGATISSLEIASLKMLELGIVLLVPILVMLLVLYSFSQVAAARKCITHHSMIRERKIVMLQQGKVANEENNALNAKPENGASGAKISSSSNKKISKRK